MVYTMWYIIIIIVVIFIISQQYVNKDRHLTQSYGHAHFSEITNLSYIFYPGLLFAKPIRITLNTGDTLLIPKNWWHWIRTEPETHAINFLCNRKDSKLYMNTLRIIHRITTGIIPHLLVLIMLYHRHSLERTTY